MNKAEKAGTDDLKRMLRRLERIEAEKAERARAKGLGQTRDLSSLPLAKRRPEMSLTERLAESTQSARRGLAQPLYLAPEPPAVATPPPLPEIKAANQDGIEAAPPGRKTVSVLSDPREFTKRGGRARQGVSAPVVMIAIAAAFMSTLATIWLTGGFDGTALDGVLRSVSLKGETQEGERAAGAGSRDIEATAPALTQTDPPGTSEPAARVVSQDRIAPDNASPVPKEEPTPDNVLAPEPIDAAAEGSVQAAGGQAPLTDAETSLAMAEPSMPAAGAPPAPVAAARAQQGADNADAPSGPAEPTSIELVAPASIAAQSGEPVPFPVTIKANSGDLNGYYLVVSGLKRGSTFSRGIELLFDTWQIPATSLSGLQLTTESGFARRMNLKLELRGPSGEVVQRTTLTVELPGPARRAVGLDGPEAAGDRPPSPAAQELIDKAEVFLDNGSLQGARMLLERAAAHGAGAAAMMLATSYDPQYAHHFSAEHPDPNAALAREWYEKAAEFGVVAARQRLSSLTAP